MKNDSKSDAKPAKAVTEVKSSTKNKKKNSSAADINSVIGSSISNVRSEPGHGMNNEGTSVSYDEERP